MIRDYRIIMLFNRQFTCIVKEGIMQVTVGEMFYKEVESGGSALNVVVKRRILFAVFAPLICGIWEESSRIILR